MITRNLYLIVFMYMSLFCSATGQIIYVTPSGSGTRDGSSWENALAGNVAKPSGYTSLAEAIKLASPGSQFWIAEGTYLTCTDNDREKSFELGQDVKIYGGFAGTETDTLQRNIDLHPTVFSGDIGTEKENRDNTKTILKSASDTWTKYSYIDAITFTLSYNDGNTSNGGGIQNSGYLSIRNCNFLKNYSNNEGGGVYNDNQVNIDRCSFTNNVAGGSGGGIMNTVGYATVSATKLSGNQANYGGAISTVKMATLNIYNSLIVNNGGNNGGGISTFAPFGGTVSSIINCTISNNSGGNVFLWGANCKVYNSIVWGGSGVNSQFNSISEFKNSIIQNVSAIPTVSDTDPLFLLPTFAVGNEFYNPEADWSLVCSSPGIDNGDTSLIPLNYTADIDGSPRIINSSIDMGAYERQTLQFNTESCQDNQGVKLELFYNPYPDVELAESSKATRSFILRHLGSKSPIATSRENSYRIRGYLIPSVSGYYKFYLTAKSASFYLSTDSMEFHKKLYAESNLNNNWPTVWTNNDSRCKIYTDSTVLTGGKPYYFEIYDSFDPNDTEPAGLRWALPGTNILQEISYTSLRPAAPKMPRNNIRWEIFKNRKYFNPEIFKNTDSVPERYNFLSSLQTKNLADSLDNFNSRIRGFIVPEVSGTYNFYFAANETGQFRLSSDTSEINSRLMSDITTPQNDWSLNISSQPLKAESKYYFEIIYHGGAGDDGIVLGWALKENNEPVVIGRNYLLGKIEGIQAHSLKFIESNSYLIKGSTLRPVYQINPWYAIDTAVIWKSSDPSIASVDQTGLIRALRPGVCNIIIKYANDTLITASTKITVNQMVREIFNYKLSSGFDVLKSTTEFPDQVSDINIIKISSALPNDNFSARIRGYLLPTVTGNYEFGFATDDFGQFWLSPDTSQYSAQLKSDITSIQSDWNQNSSSQYLVAGKKYFFEILHHEIDAYDLIKLGWKVPGVDSLEVIKAPFMLSCADNVRIRSISLADNHLTGYPGWILAERYQVLPWNADNRALSWRSSNTSVATVDDDGNIKLSEVGNCFVIASSKDRPDISDTVMVTVESPGRPWFVKPGAQDEGSGLSWDQPVSLSKVLDNMSRFDHSELVKIYVSEGTYKPTKTGNRGESFRMNNIMLVGGFDSSVSGTDTISRDWTRNETILSGEIGDTLDKLDNSYHVVVFTGSGGSSIDGFTIRDGMASTDGWYTQGFGYYQRNSCGGGILIETSKASISNCQIINNTARSTGGGLSCYAFWQNIPEIKITNCSFTGNKTLGRTTESGIFTVIVASKGAGIYGNNLNIEMKGCTLNDNYVIGYGAAVYLEQMSVANIESTTINRNSCTGQFSVYARQGATINFKNSTIEGDVSAFFYSSYNLVNTTVRGDFSAVNNPDIPGWEKYLFDNSIVSGFSVLNFSDPSVSAKYSIIGNSVYGRDKATIVSSTVPAYSTWLDTLNNNGGSTPTMKLKNVAGNPAISMGNPEYLGATDQRGVIRTDSVSIGAYQYVKTNGIDISPGYDTLCKDQSVKFAVRVLPAFADDTTYTISSSDSSVLKITGNEITTISAGNAAVIVKSAEGAFSDTCFINVKPVPPQPGITQLAFRLFSDAPEGNQWYDTEGLIDGATGQKFDPSSDGTFYVVVSVGGCSSMPSDNITFQTVGLPEEKQDPVIKVYPNPVARELNIELKDNNTSGYYEIINYSGKVMNSGTLKTMTSITGEGLPSGIYFIRIRVGEKYEVKKIIKQ